MIIPSGNSLYHVKIHSKTIDKPALVMLHGFMGSEKVFQHLIPNLAKYFSPITIDLAGHGKTITPPDIENFETENMVTELHSVLRRLHIEKFFLYGYSMGGRLALQYAVQFEKMIESLCIESAHCGILDNQERAERQKSDLEKTILINKDFSQFITNWSSLALFKNTPESLKDLYLNISKGQNSECMAASLLGFGAGTIPVICEKLNTLHIPVYYLAGKFDEKYISLMEKMHQKTKMSTFKIIDGAGHRVHADRPKDLIQTLVEMQERETTF